MRVAPVWNKSGAQKESAAFECGALQKLAERTGQHPAASAGRVSRPDAPVSTIEPDSHRPKTALRDEHVAQAWHKPRAFRPSLLDRKLRGFVTPSVNLLAACLVLACIAALAFAVGMSHALGERDAAQAAADFEQARALSCNTDYLALYQRAQQLDQRVRLHIAIDDDRCPCVCGDP